MGTSKPVVALIEDDPLVRVPLAFGLQGAGFEVVAAASGPEALAVLDDPRVAVAVVDIQLPGRIDGIGVVREARRSRPQLRAVLTTGGAPPADAAEIGPLLQKPFRLEDLVTAILEAIVVPASAEQPATANTLYAAPDTQPPEAVVKPAPGD